MGHRDACPTSDISSVTKRVVVGVGNDEGSVAGAGEDLVVLDVGLDDFLPVECR